MFVYKPTQAPFAKAGLLEAQDSVDGLGGDYGSAVFDCRETSFIAEALLEPFPVGCFPYNLPAVGDQQSEKLSAPESWYVLHLCNNKFSSPMAGFPIWKWEETRSQERGLAGRAEALEQAVSDVSWDADGELLRRRFGRMNRNAPSVEEFLSFAFLFQKVQMVSDKGFQLVLALLERPRVRASAQLLAGTDPLITLTLKDKSQENITNRCPRHNTYSFGRLPLIVAACGCRSFNKPKSLCQC